MKIPVPHLQRWADIRKEGKTHYGITRGIFGMGFPLIIAWFVYQVCFRKILEHENIYAALGEFSIIVPGTLYFGYTFARKQWDLRERQFAESQSAEAVRPEGAPVARPRPRITPQQIVPPPRPNPSPVSEPPPAEPPSGAYDY